MADSTTWHVYLVRCANGDLYTGIATDVERRFAQHLSNRGARRLRGRGPLELAFSQPVGDRATALRIEYRIKQWRRVHKEALIAGSRALPCPAPE